MRADAATGLRTAGEVGGSRFGDVEGVTAAGDETIGSCCGEAVIGAVAGGGVVAADEAGIARGDTGRAGGEGGWSSAACGVGERA